MPTALITGGNRGLGRETARQLAQRGYRVVLTARRPRAGEAVASELAGETSGEVVFHRLDVTDIDSIAALAEAVAERWQPIDALINNAGIALKGFDATVARRTMAVNFHGALAVTDALAPYVAPGGRIVMVSSGLGELSGIGPSLRTRFASEALHRDNLLALVQEFQDDVSAGSHRKAGWPSSTYNVSKAALNALTRIMARELAERHLLVNAVCPGWVRTDMGGRGAPLEVEEGADTIVWAAMLGSDGPTGGFFRDREPATW